MTYIDPIAHRAWSPSDVELNSPAREKLALKELEQVFISMLMKEMRNTVPEGKGIFESSSELTTYQEMMDDVVSEKMAEAGQFGLAKMIGEQLRIQELINNMVPTAKPEPIPLEKEVSPFNLDGTRTAPIPLEERGAELDLVPISDHTPINL
jgi:Rod binding domain-containing protein